jgi:hypothetical protein
MTAEERIKVSLLRRRGIGGVKPNNVKGTKSVRMRAVSGYVQTGDVHLWEYWPGLIGFLDETAAFPNGAYDDQVDVCSQALAELLLTGGQATTSSAVDSTIPKTPVVSRSSGMAGMAPGGGVMDTGSGPLRPAQVLIPKTPTTTR